MATTSIKGYESLINPGTASSTTTTAAAKTGSSDTLGKDDFLQLLLTELQHQDPTSPMDSDKILTQTSQLANLEASENTNAALEDLATQLQTNMNSSATSLIGKMGSLGYNAVALVDGKAEYEVYFPTEIKSGKMEIKDSKGNVLQTIDLAKAAEGKSGVIAFEWDGKNSEGEQLDDGYYAVTADYLDANNDQMSTQYGVYPVESVRYDKGSAYIKLGSNYFPMSDVVEFYEK